jgi:MarR family 2-MHQ and catechol resistance regulon transcriptional repressor
MGDISKDIQSTFPNEWVKGLINIRYTSHWISSHTEKKFTAFGISSQQYNVLRILRGAKEAIKVSVVKDRMIEKTPNTTRLMDKLCAKELIARTRCESDRRAVYVEITKSGLNLLEAIPMDDDKDILSKITEEEAKELNRILDKIR